MRENLQTKKFTSQFKFVSTLLIILCFSYTAFSQSFVKGVVRDAADNIPLPAATVLIKGTTTGTITDVNGEYVLRLNPGTHIIEFSYLGFNTEEKEVTIEKDQTIEMNVGLALAAFTGEEVVITAQARGQLAAVNQQLRSNQITNVVSAERIRELPDENAAQAISRLPGIHLDGSKVVVRGIQPKMNKILVNGVEMPSTEANDRATSLGMISANMLSGIEVFKTLTPDMDADAIGGVVNLTLREAPEGLKYNIMTQGTYNNQEKFLGNFRVWGDVSNRFLDNKLGVAINLNYSTYQGGDDIVDVGYARIVQTDNYMFNDLTVQDQVNTSTNIGGSAVVDFKLPNGKLLFSSMYSNSTPDNITYSDVLSAERLYRQANIDHYSYETKLWNNSLHYEQQLGLIKVNANLSAVSVDRADDFRYHYRFQSETQNFYSESLTNQIRLEMEPWKIYDAEVPGSWETLRMQHFRWNPNSYNENQVMASVNLEMPVTITDKIDMNFKAGGKYKSLEREYDNSSARYGDDIMDASIQAPMQEFLTSLGHEVWQAAIPFPLVRNYDYQPNGEFMNGSDNYSMPYVVNVDYTDKMAIDLMDHETLQKEPDTWRDDYWGGEDLYAGYLMAEINLGPKLLIIPGFRYESIENHYTAMEVASVSKNAYRIRDTISKPATHSNFLPHLHLRYKATNWLDVRFSFNNTLSRPDYNHAIPSVYYDVIATSGEAGNPYIKPAVSENFDLNFTFYSKKLGLLTIGGFIKNIDDVFYSQPSLIKNIPDSTIVAEFPFDEFPALADGETEFYINNPNRAFLKGLEAEWQSNFTFLPSPFNGIVLNMNYTYAWSETNYMQHRVTKEFIFEPSFKIIDVENDTVYTGRLLHQAKDIANISLGYDYKGFSARVSFRFQGNVISTVAVRSSDNVYTNNVYKYDFVMKQKIPTKFATFEVFFNAINFTNVPYKRYSDFPNRGETNLLTRYTGSMFQLGVRLSSLTR